MKFLISFLLSNLLAGAVFAEPVRPMDAMTPGLRAKVFSGETSTDISFSVVVRPLMDLGADKVAIDQYIDLQVVAIESSGAQVDRLQVSKMANGYLAFRAVGTPGQLISSLKKLAKSNRLVWAGLGEPRRAVRRLSKDGACASSLN
jgi:hypothetical protein